MPLHRILQEAVSNAVRHSGARHIAIDCIRAAESVTVRVSDDGSGIGERAGTGFGLAGMRDRIEALGGTLDIVTATGQGTAIAACLPLIKESRQTDGATETAVLGLETA